METEAVRSVEEVIQQNQITNLVTRDNDSDERMLHTFIPSLVNVNWVFFCEGSLCALGWKVSV